MQIVSTRQPSDLPKSQHSRSKPAKIKPSETELDRSTPQKTAYSKSQPAELKFTEATQSETEQNGSNTQISPYSARDLAGFEPPEYPRSRAEPAKIKPTETELDRSTSQKTAYSKSQPAELKFTEATQSETEQNGSKTQIFPYSARDLAGFEPPETTKSEDESRMDTAKLDQQMSLSLTRIPKLSNFDDFGILVLCKVSRKDLNRMETED